MATGVPTPPSVVAEFRAHYLYSGNAAESARTVGIPESTGREIARRLAEDESFSADRRKLHATHLSNLVAMRMSVAATAAERFQEVRDFGPGEFDKRPDFGKLVLEAEKNAHNLAKLEGAEPERDTTPVVIHVHGPKGSE